MTEKCKTEFTKAEPLELKPEINQHYSALVAEFETTCAACLSKSVIALGHSCNGQ